MSSKVREITELYGKKEDMSREFDISFWQSQTSEARLKAAFQMVEDYLRYKGRENELRLQRSVENFQRIKR